MNVRINGPRRACAVGRVLAAAAATMIVVAACTSGQSYVQQARQAEKRNPDERPWFCNSVGQGTPPSGHGNGNHVHPIYEGRTKGPLSWDDCKKLAEQLDQTMKAVRGFETKGKAEAAGLRQIAQYIPGLGTHHAKFAGGVTPGSIPGGGDTATITRCLEEHGVDLSAGPPDFSDPTFTAALQACGVPGLAPGSTPPGSTPPGSMPPGSMPPSFGGPFDPANPQFLIYGGPGDDAPLVGVAYFFLGGDRPPEAYAGGNDWWHLHTKICFGPNRETLAGAEEVSDAECARLGGTNRSLTDFPGVQAGGGVWLLHVWMRAPYEYRPDIFISGHSCLLAAGVAPPSDPCWQAAHRDPSLGPPPTTPTTPTTGGQHDDHDEPGHEH